MLAWLGEWLQGIVAVILLAVVMELILPNNKMLRYSRLVIGLILLLTMLNPIFNLFQKDFHQKIAASFSIWDDQFRKNSIDVPTLEEINRKAADLKKEREQASEQLTQRGLEEAMKQQLLQQGQENVENVHVTLGWEGTPNAVERMPFIQGVTVTVQSKKQVESLETESDTIIQDVQINIQGIEPIDQSDPEVQDRAGDVDHFVAIDAEQISNIITILTSSWSVNPNQIIVQAKS